MTIWRMRIECWIPKALRMCNKFSFPLQKLLHESPSMSRYTYIACLVHPDMINCYLYRVFFLRLIKSQEILGGFWLDVNHYNFSHLQSWEICSRLALASRTSDIQERITDVKREMAAYCSAQEVHSCLTGKETLRVLRNTQVYLRIHKISLLASKGAS